MITYRDTVAQYAGGDIYWDGDHFSRCTNTLLQYGEVVVPQSVAKALRNKTDNNIEDGWDAAIRNLKRKEHQPAKKHCTCCGAPIMNLRYNCEYCGVVL